MEIRNAFLEEANCKGFIRSSGFSVHLGLFINRLPLVGTNRFLVISDTGIDDANIKEYLA